MNCTSLSAPNVKDLEKQLDKLAYQEGNKPFALVFCSPQQPLIQIQQAFNNHQIPFIGCTTSGEIRDYTVMQGSIVVLFFEGNSSYFFATLENITGSVNQTSSRIASKIQAYFKKAGAIVLSGGIVNDGYEIVQGFKSVMGENAVLFGGIAGDDMHFEKTYVFNTNTISDNGIAAVGIDTSKISLKGVSISGWRPVGPIMEITKSNGNIVYEINNLPILKVYADSFGFDVSKKIVLDQGVKFPLQLISETGAEVLRAPLYSLEDGGLMFPGGLKPGQKVRFSMPPDYDVIANTVSGFKDFGTKNATPDAVILFSCFARHVAFGKMIQEEIKGLYDIWGKPLAGLFTYGEIGNTAAAGSNFHNETCSLLLIKEK
jgi:hypothetical protein